MAERGRSHVVGNIDRGNRFAWSPVCMSDGGHPAPGSGRLPGGGCVLLIPGKDGLQW
jgi:hypothetical protein